MYDASSSQETNRYIEEEEPWTENEEKYPEEDIYEDEDRYTVDDDQYPDSEVKIVEPTTEGRQSVKRVHVEFESRDDEREIKNKESMVHFTESTTDEPHETKTTHTDAPTPPTQTTRHSRAVVRFRNLVDALRTHRISARDTSEEKGGAIPEIIIPMSPNVSIRSHYSVNEMSIHDDGGGEGAGEPKTSRLQSIMKKLHIPLSQPVISSRHEPRWASNFDFVMTTCGLCIGLSNITNFPRNVYKHGGGAFLVAYTVFHVILGFPIFLMEALIGQYSALGPVKIWCLSNAFKGIGITFVMCNFMLAVFYQRSMTYSLFYMFASMQRPVPWTQCKPEWASSRCYHPNSTINFRTCNNRTVLKPQLCKCSMIVDFDFNTSHQCFSPTLSYQQLVYNLTHSHNSSCKPMQTCTNKTRMPSTFYFKKMFEKRERTKVMDGHSQSLGQPIWYLVYCLLLSWVIVALCLIKGITTTGKVVYFTVSLPYLILTCMLITFLSKDGSRDGLWLYISPNWTKLADYEVWDAAGSRMMFSLSVMTGAVATLASYNYSNANVYRYSIMVVVADYVTSFLAGMTVFTALGISAHETGYSVQTVADMAMNAEHKDALTFEVMPQALSHMSTFWSIMYFLMMYTMGLDTEIVLMEVVLTAILDENKTFESHQLPIAIALCTASFLLGIPFVTPNGDEYQWMMSTYAWQYPVPVSMCVATIVLAWVYGGTRIMREAKGMLGFSPWPRWYWMGSWLITVPICLIMHIVIWMRVEIAKDKRDPFFGVQGEVAGWLMFTCIIAPIPVYFWYAVRNSPGGGVYQRVSYALLPTSDWLPQHSIRDPKGSSHDSLRPSSTALNDSVQERQSSWDFSHGGSDFPQVNIQKPTPHPSISQSSSDHSQLDLTTRLWSASPPCSTPGSIPATPRRRSSGPSYDIHTLLTSIPGKPPTSPPSQRTSSLPYQPSVPVYQGSNTPPLQRPSSTPHYRTTSLPHHQPTPGSTPQHPSTSSPLQRQSSTPHHRTASLPHHQPAPTQPRSNSQPNSIPQRPASSPLQLALRAFMETPEWSRQLLSRHPELGSYTSTPDREQTPLASLASTRDHTPLGSQHGSARDTSLLGSQHVSVRDNMQPATLHVSPRDNIPSTTLHDTLPDPHSRAPSLGPAHGSLWPPVTLHDALPDPHSRNPSLAPVHGTLWDHSPLGPVREESTPHTPRSHQDSTHDTLTRQSTISRINLPPIPKRETIPQRLLQEALSDSLRRHLNQGSLQRSSQSLHLRDGWPREVDNPSKLSVFTRHQ